MEPTFLNGQYLIVDELTYHFDPPQREDVIIFRYPKDTSQFFIKRIIGLPGETVMIRNGVIEVQKLDGSTITLNEPYVTNQGNGPDATYPIPEGEYFVMGDNRPESSDSRSWGLLPRQDIVGRAILRLLPPSYATLFPGSTNENK
jgi:signal peptidase I